MNRQKIASAITNTLGALGYLFCLLQWLWTTALFLPIILNTDFIKQFVQEPTTPVPVTSQPGEISLLGIIFVATVAVIMIITTIYIIIKIPSTIGKTGSKITHKTTDAALPILTRHKKLPQKKRLQLTARFLFITKMILCIIPFGIIFFVSNRSISMSRDIVIVVGAVTAIFSIALFCLQAILAKLLHIEYKQAL